MREKLIELIKSSLMKHIGKSCKLAENIADDLLQNGVVVLPCKVGDKVYYITAWDEYADQNDHEQEVQRIRITRHETYFDLSNLTTLKLKDYGLWWYTDKEKWLKAKEEYRNNKREAEDEKAIERRKAE